MPFPATPAYHSDRLVYRAALSSNKDDVAFINELQMDPYTRIRLGAGVPKPWRNDKGEGFLKHHDAFLASWMIYLPKDSSTKDLSKIVQEDMTRIGWITLEENGAGSIHRKCNLAMAMHPDYQGKGYGPEAIKHVVDYAFLSCNMRKIEIEAFGWNEPALKAYRKCGFTIEGTKKESLWAQGKYWDECYLAMFRRDWLKTQKLESDIQIE